MSSKVKIFDTTLRDGEQTPGIAWTLEQKISIAKHLDALGIDVMEAGFLYPGSSDIELIKRLKKEGIRAEICVLARPKLEDIQTAAASGAKRVNIFVPTSKIQADAMKQKLDEVAVQTLEAVTLATAHGLKVEVTLMDAARANLDFLGKFAQNLQKRGVNILTLSDTVGSRDAFGTLKLFKWMKTKVTVPLSIHAHNDKGMATAISLAAVKGGAAQVHVTVAGLGDRSGNASLEEVVVGLKTRIRMAKLTPVINKIARIGKFEIPAGKAIIGKRAFSHSSGIHVGALRGFEPFDPKRVGNRRTILYGKGTGKTAIAGLSQREKLGMTDAQIAELTKMLKTKGARGKIYPEKVVVRAVKLGPRFRAQAAKLPRR